MSLLPIDTDIASFIFKDSDYASPYMPLLRGHELVLSFMTVAELFQWAVFRRKWVSSSLNYLSTDPT
jgi:tRNA(fMet)-specific endonuclease VapC